MAYPAISCHGPPGSAKRVSPHTTVRDRGGPQGKSDLGHPVLRATIAKMAPSRYNLKAEIRTGRAEPVAEAFALVEPATLTRRWPSPRSSMVPRCGARRRNRADADDEARLFRPCAWSSFAANGALRGISRRPRRLTICDDADRARAAPQFRPHSVVHPRADALNVRIRHVATLGGHLAHGVRTWLAADSAQLGARVRAGSAGRAWIDLADLFVGYYQAGSRETS